MRRKGKRLAAALFLLLAGWLLFLSVQIVTRANLSASGKADVAIVLGAAVHGNKPSPVFEERLRHAVQLYRDNRVDALLLTGGTGEGARYAESSAGRAYALKEGVPASAILTERRSHTTRQNLLEARAVMERHGLHSALLVSDPLHLPRAMRMSRDLGIDARPSPTPTSRYRSWSTIVPFFLRELYFTNHYLLTSD